MNLLITVAIAFPIGYLIRPRLEAFVVFIAINAFLFTLTSVSVITSWPGGDTTLGAFPQASTSQVLIYGAVNLVVYLIGFGLVALGARAADRKHAGRAEAVDLDPVP
jgi:hypothetical protein